MHAEIVILVWCYVGVLKTKYSTYPFWCSNQVLKMQALCLLKTEFEEHQGNNFYFCWSSCISAQIYCLTNTIRQTSIYN